MLLIVAAHYLTTINGTLLFWLAFILTRPLGAAGGDSLTKPTDQGGLGWGTSWGSVALLALLIALIIYQVAQLRRHPLKPLPYPVNRLSGEPQRPNGAVIACPPRSSGITGANEAGAANHPNRKSANRSDGSAEHPGSSTRR
jgi:hypothetical protein